MNLKHAVLGGLALIASSATYAAEVPVDLGVADLVYDDSTIFGTNITPAPGAGTVTVNWQNTDVTAFGDADLPKIILLPSVTLTPKAGFVLSGPVTVEIGVLGFVNVEGGTAKAAFDGAISVNGGAAVPLSGALVPGANTFSLSLPLPLGTFNSLVIAMGLQLSQDGAGAIIGEPTSYQVTFNAAPAPAPVPVPGAVWLLGSGLLGLAARRRKAA